MTGIAITPVGGLGRLRRPSTAGLRACVQAHRLDGDLAAGVPTWATPAHAARARRLTGRRTRAALARGLERLLAAADGPRGLSPAVPPCADQVRAARPALLLVAARLRRDGPVGARGAAQLRVLLTDGAGPCFVDHEPGALHRALVAAHEALEVRT